MTQPPETTPETAPPPQPPDTDAAPRATRRQIITHIALFLACAAIVITADQITKFLIMTNLQLGETAFNIAGLLRITYTQNMGIAFGLFTQFSSILNWIIPFVVAAIGLYYLYFIRNYKSNFLAPLAFGLLFGGSIGNLIDRFRHGFVVDFINPRFFATFNIADSAISVGLVLFVAMVLLSRPAKSDEPTTTTTS